MQEIKFKTNLTDSFGRLRVSLPQTLFDSQNEYDKAPLLWKEKNINGTTTYLTNQGAIELKVGTQSGDILYRQTKENFRYHPGKSHLIYLTAIFGVSKANCVKRIGYFDDYNGFYFQQDNTGFAVGKRSYITGSIVDTLVYQSDWNIDKLCGYSAGYGSCYKTIDLTKIQIFVIDFEYLGGGSIRFGFVIDGEIYYCHKMSHANLISNCYMSTANLPIRFEIQNTGVTATETTLIQCNSSIMSEGSIEEERGYRLSIQNPTLKNTSITTIPLISLRLKSLVNSLPNKATIILEYLDLLAKSEDIQFYLYYNGSLTEANFVDVPNSFCQYDITASAINVDNAVLIFSGNCVAGGKHVAGSTSHSITNRISLGLDTNDVSDIYTLCCRTIANTGQALGIINWRELR